MNISPVSTQTVTPKSCEMPIKIADPIQLPAAAASGTTITVTGSSSQQIPPTGAKMLPLFYIPSSTVRVSTPGGTPTITSSTAAIQKTPLVSVATAGSTPRIVTAQATQLLAPKPGAKPQHFVIQQPGGGGKQFAYLGTIIKQPGTGKELVLPTTGGQKLVLTTNVLPKLAPTPSTQQPKVASLLVPISLPGQVTPATTKGGMINLKISNGQIQTENKGCITVLRDSLKTACSIGTIPKTNGMILPDSTTLVPIAQEGSSVTHPAPIPPVQPAAPQSPTLPSPVQNSLSNPSEDDSHRTSDLNRCLKEAVDAIFSSPDQADDVTLIKVIKQCETEVIKPQPVPDDDVKIEIVKQEVTKPSESAVEEFDPVKVLEWKDGVGSLPGSDLKFRMNEFGMMEMVDDEQFGKRKRKHEIDNLTSIKEDVEEIIVNGCDEVEEIENVKKRKLKEDKIENENNVDEKEKIHEEQLSQFKKAASTGSGEDEIYCCEGCGCYGLLSEFVSSRFCSDSCASSFASKKAAKTKKDRELLLLRLRRRKKRLLQLMQQQQQQYHQRHRLKQQQQILQQRERELEQKVHVQPPATTHNPPSSPSAQSQSEEESASSDEYGEVSSDKGSKPWITQKKGFSWAKYLDHCKAKPAPVKLFKDPFPYSKNGFKIGMKLEGIDPEHPSYFCVLTVSDVQGYRIRLHFDGYPENHDFWVNADSPDIFPAGWCEKNNHKLHPPRGYSQTNFNWATYLKQCRAQPAPRNLFSNKTGNAICPSGFRIGMKLEAVDRKNSSLVCVATVADLIDNRILVHFDSWDDVYDYWADPTSPYIHPVGWCEEQGQSLTAPSQYRNSRKFSWDEYLKETKSVAAPSRAFKQRPPSGFRVGMRLECVDRHVPSLIRVAHITAVKGHKVRVLFDGWSRDYSYWVDDDSPDIHPVGWCQKTGHHLIPPLVVEECIETSECQTPGCHGVGHIKGPKYTTHNTAATCPYSLLNYNKDGLIPDRLFGKVELYECKEELAVSREKSKPTEFRNPVGRPPKNRKVESTEDVKSTAATADIKLDKEDNKLRKRFQSEDSGSLVSAQKSQQPDVDLEQLESEFCEAVRHPGYEPKPHSAGMWEVHTRYLHSFLPGISWKKLATWSQEDVANFIRNVPGCAKAATILKEQEVDGESLLLIAQDELIKVAGLKLGPAIKLYNCIALLRQGQEESVS